ncbi:MAG: hypothetical protein ACJAYC_000952 [Halieaceae bacterium]|jgi:hypothetical protein
MIRPPVSPLRTGTLYRPLIHRDKNRGKGDTAVMTVFDGARRDEMMNAAPLSAESGEPLAG